MVVGVENRVDTPGFEDLLEHLAGVAAQIEVARAGIGLQADRFAKLAGLLEVLLRNAELFKQVRWWRRGFGNRLPQHLRKHVACQDRLAPGGQTQGPGPLVVRIEGGGLGVEPVSLKEVAILFGLGCFAPRLGGGCGRFVRFRMLGCEDHRGKQAGQEDTSHLLR